MQLTAPGWHHASAAKLLVVPQQLTVLGWTERVGGPALATSDGDVEAVSRRSLAGDGSSLDESTHDATTSDSTFPGDGASCVRTGHCGESGGRVVGNSNPRRPGHGVCRRLASGRSHHRLPRHLSGQRSSGCSVRMRVDAMCMEPHREVLDLPEDSGRVDLGDLTLYATRPRPRINHVVCPATRDEDDDTRDALRMLQGTPEWERFGRSAAPDLPVVSQWLRAGTSINLFGSIRRVLSPLDVGTAGLVSSRPVTYEGFHLRLRRDVSGTEQTVSVLLQVSDGPAHSGLRMRRDAEGRWQLVEMFAR